MAKKDQDLLVAGGIIGLLIFGIYKLFFEKKQPAATTTGNAEPTPHGADPTPATPGIAEGEPTPGTTPVTTQPADPNKGGQWLPDYIDPDKVYNNVVSDPDPWMINNTIVAADYSQGHNVFPGLNP